jgi:glycerol-3-phosphate acyltransferase PlsY
MTLAVLLWIIGTYLIASIPFSVLIGRFVFGKDIRQYGDGNPGATNVKRASGSMTWFIIAVFLDGAKGLFPAGIAWWLMGWNGIEIVPIAWAALAGHAFSLYLKFNGGKSVAITGGVWIGLMMLEAILVVPILLTYWFYSLEDNNHAVIAWMLSFLLYLLLTHANNSPLLLVWLGNFMILVYRHREGFNSPLVFNCWIPILCRKKKS